MFPDALLVSGSVSLLLRVRSFLAKSDPAASSSSSPDSGGSGGSELSIDKMYERRKVGAKLLKKWVQAS